MLSEHLLRTRRKQQTKVYFVYTPCLPGAPILRRELDNKCFGDKIGGGGALRGLLHSQSRGAT